MELILKEDVKGVGYKNDIIDVKPGFGRNFLIPRKLAELATPGTKKSREELLKQVQHKQEKIKKDATEIAAKIGDSVLEIRAKAGETGKIFGSITAIQIADSLKKLGVDVDRKKVHISQDIKELGQYTVELDLHKEVQHKVVINVVAD